MNMYLIYFVHTQRTHYMKSNFNFQSATACLIQLMVETLWEVGSFYPVFDGSDRITDTLIEVPV